MSSFRMALLGTLMFAAPVVASAADQDFTVRNKTGYQIDSIYVSPHSNRNWGNDVMGRGVVLDDEETLDISFPHTATACHFDLMVAYNDGDKATWDDLNLCEISTVTLHYDRKAGTTRATTE